MLIERSTTNTTVPCTFPPSSRSAFFDTTGRDAASASSAKIRHRSSSNNKFSNRALRLVRAATARRYFSVENGSGTTCRLCQRWIRIGAASAPNPQSIQGERNCMA